MKRLTRRRFMQAAAAALSSVGFLMGRRAHGQVDLSDDPDRAERFVFAQVRTRGGDWDPHPMAHRPLLLEVMARTSVEASLDRKVLSLGSREIFSNPFLCLTGTEAFEPFSEQERDNLQLYLESGGLLFAEDAAGHLGTGFDQAFREEIGRILPKREIRRLPSNHTIYRSFYLIRQVGGRRIVHPYLEGIQLGDMTPVIYSQNDLGGAWEKDPVGNWVNQCEPGGEAQRRDAFKLGVNIVLYALTANYKQDKIHLPFIKRRVG